jgi:hypothetical protein
MRPGRALALASVAGLAVLVVPPSRAQDVGGVSDTGWWSQQPGATAKEADGVQLTWAAEAAQSVAAVHVVVPDIDGEVLLVLKEAGGFATDLGGIDLCRTTGSWQPANPGAFAARPAVACTAAPPQMGRDSTALEWTGSLAELLADAEPGDTVGIALLPRGVPPADGLPITTPFQVDLSEPTLRVLDTGLPTTVPSTAPSDQTVIEPGVGEPGYTPPALGDGGFDVGTVPPAPPVAPPTTAEISEGDDFVALGPIDGTPEPGRPWWRLAVLTPISLAGGFGASVFRKALRARLV